MYSSDITYWITGSLLLNSRYYWIHSPLYPEINPKLDRSRGRSSPQRQNSLHRQRQILTLTLAPSLLFALLQHVSPPYSPTRDAAICLWLQPTVHTSPWPFYSTHNIMIYFYDRENFTCANHIIHYILSDFPQQLLHTLQDPRTRNLLEKARTPPRNHTQLGVTTLSSSLATQHPFRRTAVRVTYFHAFE